MAIKFSQFNERTDHTSGMYLVGYDGNQNIHITVDNLFNDFINGTANTLTMFGSGGDTVVDSIVSQDTGATILTIGGQLNVDAAATFYTSVTVTGDSTLNGNVTLGDASADLITQTGTLYLNGPIKDSTDTLGAANQLLQSDTNGELTFINTSSLNIGSAENTKIAVINKQGTLLRKGDPVFISGSTVSGIEVQLADAENAAKMPAIGILETDLNNDAAGHAIVVGKLSSINTSTIDGVTPTPGQPIYVKPSTSSGLAITTTKPVQGYLIQNIGEVGTVATEGTLVFTVKPETNDVPNVTPGRILIGSTGNTIESQALLVDETNGRLSVFHTSATTTPSGDNFTLDVRTEKGRLQVEGEDVDGVKLDFENGSGVGTDAIENNGSQNQVLKIRAHGTSGTLGEIRFETNSVEAVRIDENQRVGLGTISPGAMLDVVANSSTSRALDVQTNSGSLSVTNSDSNGTKINFKFGTQNTTTASLENNGSENQLLVLRAQGTTNTDGNIRFVTNGQDAMRIDENQNVGIGTTSPASQLTANGGDIEITSSAKGLILKSPNGTRYRIKVDNSGNLSATAV